MLEPRSTQKPKTEHMDLPPPDSESQIHSELLVNHIAHEMERAGGSIPFDRYMELCLYAPGLGYYVAGTRKFGESGDFVTAPEISAIFARCLARQSVQVFEEVEDGDLLEFGAGTGALAADVLLELEALNRLPDRYLILEISPDLRQRQLETLEERAPHLQHRVQWLEAMPTSDFKGVMFGNEVLDAMPVQRFRIEHDDVLEQFVSLDGDGFRVFWEKPQTPGLKDAVNGLGLELEHGYESEINMRATPWVQGLGRSMSKGAVLLLDYGYPRSEYYHPQRREGTLMCHYRHRAHPNPLLFPGLQDITAHVDFTAIAEAGHEAGFDITGYCSQAFFLLGSGLESILSESDPNDVEKHMRMVQEVRRLTMPTGMGERFKAVAMTKGIEQGLMGFCMRDQREYL